MAGPNGGRVALDDTSEGQVLGPNESGEPFIVTGYPDRETTSFAVFDTHDTAASGTVGAFVESASGPCVITAQAAG